MSNSRLIAAKSNDLLADVLSPEQIDERIGSIFHALGNGFPISQFALGNPACRFPDEFLARLRVVGHDEAA